MSPRSEPGFRAADDRPSGAEAALGSVLMLLVELMVAAVAGSVVLHHGNRETVGMIAALGSALAVVLGGVSIVWLARSCHQCIETGPFLLLAEIWL